MPDRKREKGRRVRRVGFLAASVHTGSALQLWPPLVEEAERAGVELYILPGGRLDAEDPAERTRNRVFSLATAVNFDGAVSWASSLGGFVDLGAVDSFHERLGELPLISMEHKLPGKPVVRIDVHAGMLGLVRHMTETHGVRRMAFIRGPREHESAEIRYKAFSEANRAAGLSLDPRLVTDPLPWTAGRRAIEQLLETRGLIPGRDFDALLAASDLLLYDAVLYLQNRGYSIPADVLTAGFNDSIESRILSPAVTTVRLPFAEEAVSAFHTLIAVVTGEEVPEEKVLLCKPMVRQSCGCLSRAVREAGRRPDARSTAARAATQEGQARVLLIEAISRNLGAGFDERSAWMAPLIEAFLAAIEEDAAKNGHGFLRTLDRIMERLIRMERLPESWQEALSTLRAESLALLSAERHPRIEDLIGQARVIVSEAVVRANAYRTWRAGITAQAIRDLERDLIRLDSRERLGEVLAAHVPTMGIRAAFVVEETDSPPACRVIAGFDEKGILLGEEMPEFPAELLLPDSILKRVPLKAWIIEPLCSSDGYFGRVVIRASVPDGTVYEELRGALSSALQGFRAVDEIRRAREAAERAEALKTRFLAGVSGELRTPLRDIVEAADRAEQVLASIRGSANTATSVFEAFSFIRGTAHRQLRLTDDLLDLARSEVGELQLEVELARPEKVAERAWAAAAVFAGARTGGAEPANGFQAPARALPLIAADPERLSRMIALLLERAWPAKIEIRPETRFCVFAITRSDGDPIRSEDGLGRNVDLVNRLASAQFGRLDAIPGTAGDAGWQLRLPYPTLSGAIAAGPENGRLLLLSDSDEGESFFDLPTVDARSEVDWETAPAAAIAWAPATLADHADTLELLRHWMRLPVPAALPFLFVPPSAEYPPRGRKSIGELVVRAADAAGSIIVCDAESKRRDNLIHQLSTGSNNLIGCSSPTDALQRAANSSVALIILRDPELTAVEALRRRDSETASSPTLLIIRTLITDDALFAATELDAKTMLLNDGVLDADEFADFVRELSSGQPILPAFTAAIVKQALRYLNKHFAESIVRWKVAESVHVSEDYLSRIFKRGIGISPWDYLIRLRIREACRLLREGPDSIRNVAEAAGFQDQAYFCRMFKKITHCTPSAYRSEKYKNPAE